MSKQMWLTTISQQVTIMQSQLTSFTTMSRI